MSERRASQRKRKYSSHSDSSDGEVPDAPQRRESKRFHRSSSQGTSRYRSPRRSSRRHHHHRSRSHPRCQSSRRTSRSRSPKRSRRHHSRSNKISKNELEAQNSSDKEDEKCPICLRRFEGQKTAIPDGCTYHTFCLECLEEWSKSKNTCPVDRKEYNSILELNKVGGKVVKQIAIGFHNRFSSGSDEQCYCEVCGSYQDEESIVQCDGCEIGFHVYCLNPPLPRVPNGMWLCYECCYYYNY